MIALIALSAIITLLVAGLISLGFYFVDPSLALSVFFITIAFEIIVMEPINRLLKIKGLKEEQKTLQDMAKYEKEAGKQSVSLECEYCGEINTTPITLNGANEFTCRKCGNDNKIMIQFTTFRPTNPLESIAPQQLDELSEKELNNE